MISEEIIKILVRRFPSVRPLLSNSARRALKASIESINNTYHDAITEALIGYFESSGNVTFARAKFQRAVTEAFGSAFDEGWKDGGGELPFDGDALEWFNARLQEEFGFIDELFQQAKELRKDKEFDYFTWTTARADGYTSAVIAVYNAAAMLANGRQMLTWHLGRTEKHCSTCSHLNGQRHRASWYISKNYIPRQPGAAMQCKGYECDCSLTNDKDEEVTL